MLALDDQRAPVDGPERCDARDARYHSACRLGIVELDVPVHVIAPALGRVSEAEGDADRRRLLGAFRRTDQRHAGLRRRAPALAPVARDAAADDVLPVLAAALGDRHHVIEGELRAGERLSAVLAAVMIAGVDVRARERYVIEAALDADAP